MVFASSKASKTQILLKASASGDLHGVLDETLGWLAHHFSLDGLAAAGHRVGGEHFTGPVLIDDDSFKTISDLVPLAPLHQPQSVRLIQALRHLRPELMQTASFDTAFHATQTDLVRRFALPRALHDRGIKRYGFHGLSYKFIAGKLERSFAGIAKGRVVVAHLGSGASLCALQDGISRDTSMSFSTLDGIPMATLWGARSRSPPASVRPGKAERRRGRGYALPSIRPVGRIKHQRRQPRAP